MRLKRVLVLAALSGSIVGQTAPSLAQNAAQTAVSAETLAAAKELVALVTGSVMTDLVDKMTAQVWPGLASKLRDQNPQLDEDTVLKLNQEFKRIILDYMAEIMNQAPAIYARYFTAQEMRDIAAFYHTPIGAKSLKVMPQATADFFAVINQHLPAMQERISQSFTSLLQQRGLKPP